MDRNSKIVEERSYRRDSFEFFVRLDFRWQLLMFPQIWLLIVTSTNVLLILNPSSPRWQDRLPFWEWESQNRYFSVWLGGNAWTQSTVLLVESPNRGILSSHKTFSVLFWFSRFDFDWWLFSGSNPVPKTCTKADFYPHLHFWRTLDQSDWRVFFVPSICIVPTTKYLKGEKAIRLLLFLILLVLKLAGRPILLRSTTGLRREFMNLICFLYVGVFFWEHHSGILQQMGGDLGSTHQPNESLEPWTNLGEFLAAKGFGFLQPVFVRFGIFCKSCGRIAQTLSGIVWPGVVGFPASDVVIELLPVEKGRRNQLEKSSHFSSVAHQANTIQQCAYHLFLVYNGVIFGLVIPNDLLATVGFLLANRRNHPMRLKWKG